MRRCVANFVLSQAFLDDQISVCLARKGQQQLGHAAVDVEQRQISDPFVHRSVR